MGRSRAIDLPPGLDLNGASVVPSVVSEKIMARSRKTVNET